MKIRRRAKRKSRKRKRQKSQLRSLGQRVHLHRRSKLLPSSQSNQLKRVNLYRKKRFLNLLRQRAPKSNKRRKLERNLPLRPNKKLNSNSNKILNQRRRKNNIMLNIRKQQSPNHSLSLCMKNTLWKLMNLMLRLNILMNLDKVKNLTNHQLRNNNRLLNSKRGKRRRKNQSTSNRSLR